MLTYTLAQKEIKMSAQWDLPPGTLNDIFKRQAVFGKLEKITLISAALNPDSIASLCHCITASPLLSHLDLRQTWLAQESKEALFSAILTHENIQQVEGLGFSETILSHLALNQAFCDFSNSLDTWKKENEAALSLEHLQSRKQIFNGFVSKVQAHPKHNKARLNNLMAEFYLYLAREYQRFGDNEQAIKYFKRVLENPIEAPALTQQAQLMLTAFGERQSTPKAKVAEKNRATLR